MIDKSQLRDSSRRFTRPGLVRIPAATSGTSGIPVKLWRSLQCVAAEQAFIDDLIGLWNLSFKTARVARLRADAVREVRGDSPPYGVYREGGKKLVMASSFLSPKTASWFHSELQRFSPDVLFTHPSSGEALATFMRQQGLSLEIPVVLTSSEMLHPGGRMLLESAFNATVIDYYGMAERVVFAAGVAADGYFFNPAYGRIELVPVDDDEAPEGYRALEIAATGFWNEAMPLVRYRTGDRVVVPQAASTTDLEDICLGLAPVRSIQGRDKEHVISPSGEVVVGLTHATSGIRGLVRLQIVQTVPEAIEVRVVPDPRTGRIDEEQLSRNLREFLPQTMSIRIETVSEIERLPNGKTPFVIRRLTKPAEQGDMLSEIVN